MTMNLDFIPYVMGAEEIADERRMVREFASADQQWRAEARCVGVDTSFFFPEFGTSVTVQLIKDFCAGCAVSADCYDYAARQRVEHGWWAGMSGLNIVKQKNRGI
jgi:hypothetical protein